MKEVKLYVCEHCGTQFKEKDKAEKCEKSHNSVKKIICEKYHSYGNYPDRVEICFVDGKTLWYKR